MDRDDHVHARALEQFRVQPGREGLAVELLEILHGALLFVRSAVRAAILGAEEQIRFNQDDLLGAVVLGAARQHQVAHGQGAARVVGGRRADDHGLAAQLRADPGDVAFIADEARTELGVRVHLQGDDVGYLFGLADHVPDVDRERVVGNVADDDEFVHVRQRPSLCFIPDFRPRRGPPRPSRWGWERRSRCRGCIPGWSDPRRICPCAPR